MYTDQRWTSVLDGLKLMRDRITFSRLTIAYFVFSLLHFILQVSLQTQAFSINARAADTLFNVLVQGNAAVKGFTVYDGDLRVCNQVPSTVDASSCEVIWDGTPRTNNWAASNPSAPSASIAPAIAAVSSIKSSSTSALPTPTPSSPPSSNSPVQTVSVSKTVTIIKIVDVVPTSSAVSSTSSHPSPSTVVAFSSEEDENAAKKWEHNPYKRHVFGQIHAVKNDDGTFSVNITGDGYDHTAAILNSECLAVLNWPVEILQNTKREDVTFIAFQFWVLGMSIVALFNESIPHIIASLLTHLLATAWAGFQISHTANFRKEFIKLTTQGACKPINLLPHYWKDRGNAEIPSLALNVLALLISCFLTWKLVKAFGWQTFKRVGASLTINRIYKIVLTLSITIQITLFFMACTLGLWIDQLFNGSIAHLAIRANLYRGLITAILVLLVPWLMMGWFAVRREHRLMMSGFLVISVVYMVGWGAMFISTTFRWTFVQWRFFAMLSSASVLLTLASFILGLVCRLNFGKGLTRYLSAQQPLEGEEIMGSDEDRDIEEKIDFPSRDQPVPTFSVTFESGMHVPPPIPRLGPRFYNHSNAPFEPQPLTTPQPAHLEGLSEKTNQSSLNRSDSGRSTDSGRSSDSGDSHHTESGRTNKKRWVIE